MKLIIAFAIVLVVAKSRADQTYPGTSSRPILSANEAARYTRTTYLQGWTPEAITTSTADFTVGQGGYLTIQAAVNAAVTSQSSKRVYIRVPAGNYSEIVIVPNSRVPITIYGDGASNTVISLSVSATLTGSDYRTLVGHLFASGDPAYNIFNNCANRASIGTSCAAVFWITAPDLELINVTVENSSKKTGTDQAVALNVNADRVQVRDSRFLGHQDTLLAYAGTTNIVRQYFLNNYVEGDIDFVFGDASAVFEQCTFYVKSDRRSNSGVVFAPSTYANHTYGYLVVNSTFTGDRSWFTSRTVTLARAWDMGLSSASDYVAGQSPNGQLVIRDSRIEGVVPVAAPYTTATSGRVYAGDANTNRNLDDNNYNRFWEYNNSGNGA